MKPASTFLLAALFGVIACGDDGNSDAPPDSGNDDDAGTSSEDAGRDAASPSLDAGHDAGSDSGSPTDAGARDAGGGGDAGPKPVKVSCGANVEPVDCPVCANSSGCSKPTYTENGNGTVTSSCCSLVWEKAQTTVDRNWQDAYAYCASLKLGGSGGFRLPTIAELNTLVISKTWPTIDLAVFPNTPEDSVWTSTEWDSESAWQIIFGEGEPRGGDLSNGDRVRCVR